QAKLVLAGPWSGLFVDQDLADVLVAYPRAWSGRLRDADTVRALTPDIAMLLPNSFESAASAWYWRAKRRIGFSAGGRDWLLTDRVTVPAPRRHQIDEYLMLLEPLRVRSADTVPALTPPPSNGEARKTVGALLGEPGAAAGPGIGVDLGAAVRSRSCVIPHRARPAFTGRAPSIIRVCATSPRVTSRSVCAVSWPWPARERDEPHRPSPGCQPVVDGQRRSRHPARQRPPCARPSRA